MFVIVTHGFADRVTSEAGRKAGYARFLNQLLNDYQGDENN